MIKIKSLNRYILRDIIKLLCVYQINILSLVNKRINIVFNDDKLWKILTLEKFEFIYKINTLLNRIKLMAYRIYRMLS